MSNKPLESHQHSEEEDDLDDLDDYLDEFQDEILNERFVDDKPQNDKTEEKEEDKKQGEERKVADDDLDAVLKQLEQDSPEAKKLYEQLLKDLTNIDADTSNNKKDREETPADFKDTISSTVNRLKESGAKVDQDIRDEDPSKLLADLISQLSMGEGSGGAGAEDQNGFDLENLLGDILGQLASKTVLYEPLKDLSVKYPAWLKDNKESVPEQEFEKFTKQNEIVQSIVAKFESSDYDESNKVHKDFIANKLEEMQQSGNPPKELMGDLGKLGLPGFQFDDDDLPEELDPDIEKQLEQNCAQQ